MQPASHISIPQPCHENWQQMTPKDNGRHCQSCCKTVVDFTSMTTGDIVALLAVGGNTCGRFAPNQLEAINYTLKVADKRWFTWKGLIAAVSLSALLPTLKASAQTVVKTEQAPVKSFMLGRVSVADTLVKHNIQGTVISKDDNLPLFLASINIKGVAKGVTSDKNGRFNLPDVMPGQVIVFSYIGMKPLEVKASELIGRNESLCLEMQYAVLGEIAVVRKPPLHKRVINKIKRIF